jgi:hypothetical protein
MNHSQAHNSLNQLFSKLPTVPFLFAGSGLTIRYYGLPSWKELLTVFARRIQDDIFAYAKYENRSNAALGNLASDKNASLYPQIAEFIEEDFNERWFQYPNFRTIEKDQEIHIRNGASPFKVEVASYIKKQSQLRPEYEEEVNALKSLFKKSISGVITTNYDCFIESISDDYTPYIGQAELLFSTKPQGIAEIYKIHGCVRQPESIVINKRDYQEFKRKSAYLAAKLLTTFLEFPIIFIGYSINDANIHSILESIADCLSTEEHMRQLENRLIFVEYTTNDMGIFSHSITVNKVVIPMTKVRIADFKLLYEALSQKKRTIPIRLLRLFKHEFYSYVQTSQPTSNIVVNIDDKDITDEKLIVAIGKASDLAIQGLKALPLDAWYRNIILGDLDYSPDDLLEYRYPDLYKEQKSLPVRKYLAMAHREHSLCLQQALNFDDIINQSLKEKRDKMRGQSVQRIWANQEFSLEKKARSIASLNKEDIDVDELEAILFALYKNNPDVLSTLKPAERSDIRRLIKIYDCLRYQKNLT